MTETNRLKVCGMLERQKAQIIPGTNWFPVKQICRDLDVDMARHWTRLYQSGLAHRLVKMPGRDGRQYDMMCIQAQDVDAFKRLVRSARRYRVKP
jgi:hypothetical protein